MLLQLEAIKFNHDPSSANVDAFNIRKNHKEFVEAPEWRRGVNLNPEDSPAAYSLFDTRGNTLTIQASFSCTDSHLESVDIRAVDGHIYPRQANTFIGSTLAVDLLRPFLFAADANLLGEVQARNVRLSNGTSGFKTFNLNNVRIWDAGVAVQDIIWRWQYRIPPFGLWTDFATTRHRIYTTVSRPQEPWQQCPFDSSNMQLPWAAVLEYACRWAARAQNPTDAAKRITHSLYQLGKDGIANYCESTQYTDGNANVFKCAAFLYDLKLGRFKLNCTDCATVVSTFANILGSELWQSGMGMDENGGFKHNPILRIGDSRWVEATFNFHVVAWEEDCDVHNDVFDACLQVDGDRDPTAGDSNHIGLLPTDLRFGKDNEKLYRHRLVSSDNPPTAARPAPTQRKRRFIQSVPVVECSMLTREVLDSATRHFDLSFDEELTPELLTLDDDLLKTVLSGWTQLRGERVNTKPADGVLSDSLWRQCSATEADALLLVKIYQGSSVPSAFEWLQHSIAALHSFDSVNQEAVEHADAFFRFDDQDGIIFLIRNVVVSLLNVQNAKSSLMPVAENLLQELDAGVA